MKKALIILFGLLLHGCAIHAVDVKTMTIPPQKVPVTVVVKGTATCQDFILFYYVTELLDVQSNASH